ncbi:MAG: RNA polymerase sigma factor RpoH [Gammaproteobacteria bacterium]|nr:RNA polymerase sigma factor RpoH [Gammaproteobacteria bacterium]
MSQALTLPFNLPVGSDEAYLQAVQRMPMLDAAREHDLARRFRDEDDLDAARELVLSHLRFVVRIARGYSGYGLSQNDLIQEGNIGLMKAVKRFDPELGVRLVSFAVHWIKAEMHEFILRNWRIVKVATTKAQRKLFFNLRGARKRLGWMRGDEVSALASDLGVSEEEVLRMEERLNAVDASFDGSSVDGDDEMPVPANYLADYRFEPEQQLAGAESEEVRSDRLAEAMDELDDRSRDIIVKRWLTEPKQTLHDLAATYAISAERVRQIEKAAMDKLRDAVDMPLVLTHNG